MGAVACPLCGAKDARFLRSLVNRDPASEKLFPRFSVSVCRRCGLIHQNPRVSRAKMAKYYKSLSDKTDGGVTTQESRSRLKAVEALRRPPARLLEAGCSDGSFLELAAEAGYEVAGVEPSKSNIRRARAAGRRFPIHEGFLESFRPAERFDVLCHFYVLEYSFEPRRFLEAARRLLKPDGVMLLEVPDAAAFSSLPFAGSLFSHQDICLFTRPTLEALLKTSGFAQKRLPGASKSYGLRAAAWPGRAAAPRWAGAKAGAAAMRRYFAKRDAMLARVERRLSGFAAKLEGGRGPVVIFGAGDNGRIVTAAGLYRGRELVFCDNNAALHGKRVDGRPVVAPAHVPKLRPALCIAASVDYQDDMVRQLRGLGVPQDRIVKLYEDF